MDNSKIGKQKNVKHLDQKINKQSFILKKNKILKKKMKKEKENEKENENEKEKEKEQKQTVSNWNQTRASKSRSFWKSSRQKNIKHTGDLRKFRVIKINSYGKKQKRIMNLSRAGCSNLSGNKTRWFLEPKYIYNIQKIQSNHEGLVLTALHKIKFECQDQHQFERIIDAFNLLNLGKLLNPESQITESSKIPNNNFKKEKEEEENQNEQIETQKNQNEQSNTNINTNTNTNTKLELELDLFDLLNVIGEAKCGKVIQVQDKINQKIYAMKFLDKSCLIKNNEISNTILENDILSTINHPFIVKLHASFQNKTKLFFILDYVSGGELIYNIEKNSKQEKTQKAKESIARFYLAEILLALEHLHSNDITYRNLNPKNILLDSEGHIKLIDFSKSRKVNLVDDKKIQEEKTEIFYENEQYLAPEILQGEKEGKAVDLWSFGILFFEILTKTTPFYSSNQNEIKSKIIQSNIEFPSYIRKHSKSLIRGLLKKNPNERLGINGFEEIKSHPFFKGINFSRFLTTKTKPPIIPEIDVFQNEDYYPKLSSINVNEEIEKIHFPMLINENEKQNENENENENENDYFQNFSFISKSFEDSIQIVSQNIN
ncbi:ribosomal protein S6 KINASE [Anaeramoeba ignava]|uniref:Ribosomal protein S6 KINASE n=1 Tax=Anaeramoeba ignava TaxID=1746090 RepID=A0A9Q0LB66_ANAIG|nr:ribosomal protein S6 KINASE [Anaeramoeba ignava]